LPSSFEDYLASLGQKFRRNIRKAFRDAKAAGLTICELHPQNLDPVELPDIYFHLLMCRHSDKELSEQILAQSFVGEVLPAMFRKGSMRVFAVIQEGRIIAVLLALVAAKGFLAWSSGFLTGSERWSPGTMLFAFAIKQAIDAGLREFDFGEGDEAYKQHWTNGEYRVTEVELIPKC
ncbi:MAG TPA: GNAT family N-acetyltransferase, partial [Candidatus Angelobacter sp.]